MKEKKMFLDVFMSLLTVVAFAFFSRPHFLQGAAFGIVLVIYANGKYILDWIENTSKNKEKEEKKRQEIDKMISVMDEASRSELVPALSLLKGVGIYSDSVFRGQDIHLPPFFWEASFNLVATSLVTIVWGNNTVKKEYLFQELSGIIDARAKISSIQAIKVAMLIQKKRPEATEKLFV